jgi:hypothetical protein
MTENEIATVLVNIFLRVHKELGPAFWNLYMKQPFAMNWLERHIIFKGRKV